MYVRGEEERKGRREREGRGRRRLPVRRREESDAGGGWPEFPVVAGVAGEHAREREREGLEEKHEGGEERRRE